MTMMVAWVGISEGGRSGCEDFAASMSCCLLELRRTVSGTIGTLTGSGGALPSAVPPAPQGNIWLTLIYKIVSGYAMLDPHSSQCIQAAEKRRKRRLFGMQVAPSCIRCMVNLPCKEPRFHATTMEKLTSFPKGCSCFVFRETPATRPRGAQTGAML
jgi:hypothetical protein